MSILQPVHGCALLMEQQQQCRTVSHKRYTIGSFPVDASAKCRSRRFRNTILAVYVHFIFRSRFRIKLGTRTIAFRSFVMAATLPSPVHAAQMDKILSAELVKKVAFYVFKTPTANKIKDVDIEWDRGVLELVPQLSTRIRVGRGRSFLTHVLCVPWAR